LGHYLSDCRLDSCRAGFGGAAGFAVEAAKIIFVVAIILFLISAVFGVIRGRRPTVP
jgi:uncharacterized membrane protein YtjA (UPF0391 family)